MKITKYALAVALGLMGLLRPTAARADNFTFSFTNTVGTVSGTVTGEIFGLTNNDTPSAASDVIITSFPAGFGVAPGGPIDEMSPGYAVYTNSFTENGGNITAAAFANDLVPQGLPYGSLYLNQGGGLNLLGDLNVGGQNGLLYNQDGLAGVTYTLVATPEPPTLLMFGTGLLGLMGMTTLRKRLA